MSILSNETRFSSLARKFPDRAKDLFEKSPSKSVSPTSQCSSSPANQRHLRLPRRPALLAGRFV